jgi:paraquat-inducible protein B
MSRKASPTLIGSFVLGALALAIVGISVFGSGRFFRETYPYILYFESDVSGLSEGANVKLKGVQIGSVKKILLGVGEMSQLRAPQQRFHVPVIIELDADKTFSLGSRTKPDPETIANLVARGLRAQLASESFVTGVLYVKLDLFPDTEVTLRGSRVRSRLPEIPTLPTPLEEVQTKFAEFFAELQKVDIAGLVDEIKAIAASAREILGNPGLRGALDRLDSTVLEFERTLASIRETSEEARGSIGPLREDLSAALARFDETLAETKTAMSGAGSLVKPGSPLVVALESALADVSATSKALKDLAALLERNPESLLRGRAAPPEAKP